ncbi:MAG TPA: Mur ligase family protein [Candidatus Parcubacteria bacterium]|jgi:UDP-N-acetylmuramoyl-tripeptide--D-alanyl-D-alanine ligase|nr:Mur ligase family protein [Candidatus Parcubacteria bacterium]|tara:strand:+ start:348 stop:1871 length:1524 start_codon:yes stop_codon:yes gene_type:complete
MSLENFSAIYLLTFFFWILTFNKRLFFWFWLWQLKEYHLGRFKAHFQTDKGKQLVLNKFLAGKIIVLLGFLLTPFFFSAPTFNLFAASLAILLSIYLIEGTKVIVDMFKKRLKSPVLTKKTVLIIGLSFLAQFLFLEHVLKYFFISILLLDILSPFIASFFVGLIHPLTVFWRWQIIKKAKEKRSKFKDLIVIGITGSYGKTSTKEILAHILSKKFKVLKTKKHQNSEVGVSQCVLNELTLEHEVFVVEMGAYNRGGIKLLSHIVSPKIGILTGINEQHMVTFKSLENIIKTKYELIESLPKDGTAFFNGRNEYCLELFQKTNIKKSLYGENVELAGMENIEGAKAVARELGMTNEEIDQACEEIKSKFPGLQLKKGINGLNIIDASYSANPDSLISHLDYLKTLPAKKIIVMPCLIELGKAAKKVHNRIGERIGKVSHLVIITTKDYFEEIKKSAISSGFPKENILYIEDPKKIIEKIKEFSKPGDIVLLEGRIPLKTKLSLIIEN